MNEKKLRQWLHDFRFKVISLRGFNEATINCGGVATREIKPKTIASKLIENLYHAGEIIDLDAKNIGVYILQIAFSTGWLARWAATKINT